MLYDETTSVDAARVASVVNFVSELFHSVGGWNTVGPAAVFLLLLLFAWYRWSVPVRHYSRNNLISRWRERRRMRASEEKRQKELASDLITDSFEKAFNSGEMTFEMKQSLYRQIGKRCGLTDLVARGLTSLKDEIKTRVATTKKDADGKVIPVNLPKEEVTPTKKKALVPSHVHLL